MPLVIILQESALSTNKLYFSQKQMPREMEPRLVILECAGYILWQLFMWRLYIYIYIYML